MYSIFSDKINNKLVMVLRMFDWCSESKFITKTVIKCNLFKPTPDESSFLVTFIKASTMSQPQLSRSLCQSNNPFNLTFHFKFF